jgi:AcrR family transcriptional regulator
MTITHACPSAAQGASGASSGGTASPRERLLEAAAELFYRKGVAIPTDELCKAAGVSKRSMYQLFGSKDGLLAAALERTVSRTAVCMFPPPELELSSRARMLYVFERLEEDAAAPGYLGCPYVAAMVELKDPAHPACIVAACAKRHLLDYFRVEAARAGAADPGLLARQLAVVYDGASTRAGIGVEHLRGLAVSTATALLDSAGLLA